MKKKNVYLIIVVVLIVLMLIPIPMRLKDGGSVEYKAILYKYTKIHKLNEKPSIGYIDGWELKILGVRVGGNTNTHVLVEHTISIKNGNKIVDANTGGFCYKNGTCVDKIDFQDFKYDIIKSHYNNKLYIENLDGTIKSVELFDYSLRKFIDTKVDFTNEYIVTPSISGLFIVKINATYEGKGIEYYFKTNISKTNGEEINLKIELKENTLSNVGLTMIVENLSDKDLTYGNPYSIEKYEDGYWKKLSTINDLNFTLPAFHLKKGESKELNINWEYGYGKLKGKYRIVKNFAYNENDSHISFNKYLEFEIK